MLPGDANEGSIHLVTRHVSDLVGILYRHDRVMGSTGGHAPAGRNRDSFHSGPASTAGQHIDTVGLGPSALKRRTRPTCVMATLRLSDD